MFTFRFSTSRQPCRRDLTDLIRNCEECKLAFYSPQLYAYHQRNHHKYGQQPAAVMKREATSDNDSGGKRVKSEELDESFDENDELTIMADDEEAAATTPKSDVDDYQPYMAAGVTMQCNDEVDCLGCGVPLPCAGRQPGSRKYSEEFYRHCIKECAQYKQLGG